MYIFNALNHIITWYFQWNFLMIRFYPFFQTQSFEEGPWNGVSICNFNDQPIENKEKKWKYRKGPFQCIRKNHYQVTHEKSYFNLTTGPKKFMSPKLTGLSISDILDFIGESKYINKLKYSFFDLFSVTSIYRWARHVIIFLIEF